MKIFRLFLCIVLSSSAFAFNETSYDILPLKKRYVVENLDELAFSENSQRLIANMTLAIQSIDFGLKLAAIDHANLARQEASKLLVEAKVKSTPMTFPMAKLSSQLEGETRHYYVPVWYTESISEEVEESNLRKWPQVQIRDTKIILTSVQVDVSNAIKSLDQALKDLDQNNLGEARKNIDKIFQTVIVTESVIHDPLLTVWANLELAKEFVIQQNFKSARYTLNEAKRALKGVKKKKFATTKLVELTTLEKELDTLAKELDLKAPGFLLRAKTKIKELAKKVKEWV